MGTTPLVHQHHLLLLSLFLLPHFFPAASLASTQRRSPTPAEAPASSSVLASCAEARYASLCVRTLSSSSQLPASSTPADLAIAAVSASLASARDAAGFISRLLADSASNSGPLDDCRELVADAADLLEATEGVLRRLRRKTSRRQLDDALTWASAALTNQDTCVEGIHEVGADEGKGAAVVERVSCVSQYTSNALHLISRLTYSSGRSL